jgi:hypothetical protein
MKKATKPAVVTAPLAASAPKPAVPSAPVTPVGQPVAATMAPRLLSMPVKPVAPVAKTVTSAERGKMIEFEAYLLAEKNNFQGDPADYWTRGEAVVESKLGLIGGCPRCTENKLTPMARW